MSKLYKEPLVQFLLGGAILYGALFLFAPDEGEEGDPLVIQLSDDRLRTYLQYQDKAFDTDQAKQVLDGLDEQARQKLEDEYIRDEIMVREAMALGLDQNDDVIDQRLIQKMDFVFQGFAEPDETITPAEISAYYEANQAAYSEEAQVTFTHVFFKADEQTAFGVEAQAQEVLETLKAKNVPFEDAGQYGDRFYFFKNYVNRPRLMVEAHFGKSAASRIFNPDATRTWFGPIRSKFGVHLFLVRKVKPSRTLDLAEVTGQVRSDLMRERRNAARRENFERVAQKYSIEYTADK